jgi:hypothetical protein
MSSKQPFRLDFYLFIILGLIAYTIDAPFWATLIWKIPKTRDMKNVGFEF